MSVNVQFPNVDKRVSKVYRIIIKQDTDAYLNIYLVEAALKKLLQLKIPFVLGKIWCIKNERKRYPSGMSYIFSAKSINRIIKSVNRNIYKIKNSFEEDMLFGALLREANFSFFDSFISFNYITYLSIPKIDCNIENTFMVHELRIFEIAFLHFIIIKTNLINRTCRLHS